MRPAIDAVRETGTAVAEVAMCYTGDLSDPGERLYTLDYYLRLAEQMSRRRACAGHQGYGRSAAPRPRRGWWARQERFDLPVHVHARHPGRQLYYLAAWSAGRRRSTVPPPRWRHRSQRR